MQTGTRKQIDKTIGIINIIIYIITGTTYLFIL